MSCNKCGLEECICFIEDIPDAPFYDSKYCVLGKMYKIVKGSDYPKVDIYALFAEKWYNTAEEAEMYARQMASLERQALQRRIDWIDKRLS